MSHAKRDEKKRKAFVTRLSRIPPEKRVYVDESGFDNASRVSCGCSLKGFRCIEPVRSRASERMTAIAGQRPGKTLAPLLFGDNTNTVAFTARLGHALIPELSPGDKIIIDNASFHKLPKIRRMLRRAGCGLWYLPPYSPDLNKIEPYWSKVKKIHAVHMMKTDWRAGESVFESFQKCPNLTD